MQYRKQLIRGSIQSSIFSFSGQALNLVLKSFVSKSFGTFGIGVYEILMSSSWIGSRISQIGIQQSIVKFISENDPLKNRHQHNPFITVGLLIVVVASMALGLLILFFSDPISKILFGSPVKAYAYSLATIIPLMAISQYLVFALRGLKKVGMSVFLDATFYPLGSFTVLCILNFMDVLSVTTFIKLLPVCYMAIVVVALFNIRTYLEQLKSKNSVYNTGKTLIKYSFPIWGISVTKMMALKFDKIILAVLITTEEVGLYAAAYTVGSALLLFDNIITPVSQPLIAQSMASRSLDILNNVYNDIVILAIILIVPVYSILVLFGDTIITLVFGASFEGSVLPMVIIATAYLFNTLAGPSGTVLLMGGEQKSLFKYTLVSLGITYLLYLVLLPKFNILGASLSVGISWTTIEILKLAAVRKKFGINTFGRKPFKVLLQNVGLILTCYLSVSVIEDNTYRLVTYGILLFSLYSLFYNKLLLRIIKVRSNV